MYSQTSNLTSSEIGVLHQIVQTGSSEQVIKELQKPGRLKYMLSTRPKPEEHYKIRFL